MEIQSAFNSGVQGFQQAVETANTAASNIARATTVESNRFQEENAISSSDSELNETPTSNENEINSQSIPNLNQSIVELKVAEYQAKASAEVIKSADENLGTLLDVTA